MFCFQNLQISRRIPDKTDLLLDGNLEQEIVELLMYNVTCSFEKSTDLGIDFVEVHIEVSPKIMLSLYHASNYGRKQWVRS